MSHKRYLLPAILADLNRQKMVFIGGPRQVGKTTLAQMIGETEYPKYAYFSWDNREHRRAVLAEKFPAEAKLIIFDELHKYKNWKNYLKGQYDLYRSVFHILVTGSARLDLYRRGGDSLLGRYHYYRLHPFSLAEALGFPPSQRPLKPLVFKESSPKIRSVFHRLLTFGGFPEPFLRGDLRTLRRFQRERPERLVKEDIRDIESVRDISALQILTDLLPGKVGSLFSLNALREDLEVTHKTLSHWAEILERFYYLFRIYPFASRRIRSLKKEPKMYLWDWSEVPDEAARLENLVASHLLKMVHFLEDTEGYKTRLYFLRDTEGRELDFLVTLNERPWFGVEVKTGAKTLSRSALYFKEKLTIPWVYQVTLEPGHDYRQGGLHVISADKFLTGLV